LSQARAGEAAIADTLAAAGARVAGTATTEAGADAIARRLNDISASSKSSQPPAPLPNTYHQQEKEGYTILKKNY